MKQNKILQDIHGHYCFWINNGPVVKNIQELPKVLKNMDKDTFSHHVNKEKNDFAKWIDEVIGDIVLAKSLKRVKRKDTYLRKIETRLKELNKAK